MCSSMENLKGALHGSHIRSLQNALILIAMFMWLCSKFAPISLFVVKPWISGFIFQESRRQIWPYAFGIIYQLSGQFSWRWQNCREHFVIYISLNNILKSLVSSG